MLPPHCRVATATAYSTTWAMAVKDTSGEPVRMRTMSTPTAMIPVMEELFTNPATFSYVRNTGLVIDIAAHRTTTRIAIEFTLWLRGCLSNAATDAPASRRNTALTTGL